MKSEEFFANISRSLGRESSSPLIPDAATHLSLNADRLQDRARQITSDIQARAGELMEQVEQTSAEAGWRVFRTESLSAAADHIRRIAQDIEARAMLRTTHGALDALDLESEMRGTGISLEVMALEEMAGEAESDDRAHLRQQAINADIGITGVDYAIAETGSCVLLPRKGVSRVISLLPPVHIAVVQPGQVLPSLDELFTLRRQDFLTGDIGSYLNIITGPSRSADIEYQLVTGVHGPGEVHMILLG